MTTKSRFTITRRIELDAAHRVPDHRSKCFALHGHRYVVNATVSGPLHRYGEQRGMVMDFGFLKEVMMEEIHDPCDHGLILWREDYDVLDWVLCPEEVTPLQNRECRERILTQRLHIPKWLKLYQLDDVPTAENLACHWFSRLSTGIHTYLNRRGQSAEGIQLDAVEVYETPNSIAVYKPTRGVETLDVGTKESPTNG